MTTDNLRKFGRAQGAGSMVEHIRKQEQAKASAAARKVQTESEDEPAEAFVEAAGAAEQLLTPGDLSAILGVGVRTLERWRREGEGPRYLQLSRKSIRYRVAAVAAFIREAEKKNTAQ